MRLRGGAASRETWRAADSASVDARLAITNVGTGDRERSRRDGKTGREGDGGETRRRGDEETRRWREEEMEVHGGGQRLGPGPETGRRARGAVFSVGNCGSGPGRARRDPRAFSRGR